MAKSFDDYLALLDDIGSTLEQLTGLASQKTKAVQKDDLLALDEVMKQEQALALSLRGLEQRRTALNAQLGLEDTPLSGLAQRCPPSLRARAADCARTLKNRYDIYRTAADVCKNTLEINLHQIELVIAAQGGARTSGAGYGASDVQPPERMKTDFRA